MKNLTLLATLASAFGCGVRPTGNTTTREVAQVQQNDAAVALTPFERTMHPLLKANCGGCHGDSKVQNPLFAVSESKDALENALRADVFVPSNPPESRLVKRLSEDSHHCWGDCKESARIMLKSIEDFMTAMKSEGKDVPNFKGKDPGLDLVEAYRRSAHPIVTKYCGECHGENHKQAPFFAVQDAAKGATSLIDSGKVDLAQPDNSRIYIRLAKENHKCWIACDKSAKIMLDAIKEWAALAASHGQEESKRTDELMLTSAQTRNATPELGALILAAADGTLNGRMLKKDDAKAHEGKYLSSNAAPLHPVDGVARAITTQLCNPNTPTNMKDPRYVSYREISRFPDQRGPRRYLVSVSVAIVNPNDAGSPLLDYKRNPVDIRQAIIMAPKNTAAAEVANTPALPADFYYDPTGKRWQPTNDSIPGLLTAAQKASVLQQVRDTLNGRIFDDNSFIAGIDKDNLDTWVKYSLDVDGQGVVSPIFGPRTLDGTALHPDVALDATRIAISATEFGELPLEERSPGVATYHFQVKEEGYFALWGSFLTSNGRNFGFRIRDAAGAYRQFYRTDSENVPRGICYNSTNGNMAAWGWTTVMDGEFRRFWKLEPGEYDVEVIATDARSQIDKIALVDLKVRPEFNPAKHAFDERFISSIKPQILSWDVSKLLGTPATFEMEIADFSAAAYRFRNPRLIVKSSNVHVKGIRVLVNGARTYNDETFAKVDRVMGTNAEIIQFSGLVVLKQDGAAKDKISISFDAMKATPELPTVVKFEDPKPPQAPRECRDLAMFQRDVAPILSQISLVERPSYNDYVANFSKFITGQTVPTPQLYTCTSCHNADHLLFKMSEFVDPKVLCMQALSRANFAAPEQSILLRGPSNMFGHPSVSFIEDVVYTGTGFAKWTFNGANPRFNGKPMLQGTFIGKFPTYTQAAVQAQIDSAPSTADQAYKDALAAYVGRPVRVVHNVNNRGEILNETGFPTLPTDTSPHTYPYTDAAVSNPLIDNATYATWKLKADGADSFETLRTKYSNLIKAWITREVALAKAAEAAGP